jgi:hypothetical protein
VHATAVRTIDTARHTTHLSLFCLFHASRKSLRLQKLVKDEPAVPAAGPASVLTAAPGATIEETPAEEADDFFSPFPDSDALAEVETSPQEDINNNAAAPKDEKGKTEFQTARRRHSVMPVNKSRRSDPPLLPTSSVESIAEEPGEEEHAQQEGQVGRGVLAVAARSRAPTRRAASRASSRRAAR